MKKYNGHRSWNAWNVSLWLSNDESSYFYVMNSITYYGLKKAIIMLSREWAGKKTPDGAIYNKISIKLALEGLAE
tara:strand:+ start:225 stop:449 length:225 start_codon:yes stop_codon:yes gene_type:complete